MKQFENLKIGFLAFLFFGHFCFGQSKQELIESIVTVNQLESNCIGFSCEKSSQFNNFEKLKSLISEEELINLSQHPNAVLRTYAILDLINSEKNNIPELLEQELIKNEKILTFDGCIKSSSFTYSKIYNGYWNKLLITEYENENSHLIETDKTLIKLDSLIIYYPKDLNWLTYNRTFENRKFNESYLPRIVELAFKKNNSYAFDYLHKNYSDAYSEQISEYFKTTFPNAKFENENEIFYLHKFLEFLFESGNDEFVQIAKAKLKNDKSWRKLKPSWFKHSFEKYGIKL